MIWGFRRSDSVRPVRKCNCRTSFHYRRKWAHGHGHTSEYSTASMDHGTSGDAKKGECDFYDFNFWRRKCGHDFAAFIYGVLIPEPNGTQLLD